MDNPQAENESELDQIHYIREWATKLNIQPKRIVEFTGADKGLVSRWFKGTLPKGRYLNLLSKLFDIPVSDLFVDPATKDAELGAEVPINGLMPVDGYAAASTWQELDELGQEPKDWINYPPDPAYGKRRQFAVEVRGNSMDKLIKPGNFAVVVDAFGQAPRDGDVVLVRRVRGNLVERTIKRYRQTVNGAVLMPESTDPKYEPIPATGDGDTIIEIEGYVIAEWGRIARR